MFCFAQLWLSKKWCVRNIQNWMNKKPTTLQTNTPNGILWFFCVLGVHPTSYYNTTYLYMNIYIIYTYVFSTQAKRCLFPFKNSILPLRIDHPFGDSDGFLGLFRTDLPGFVAKPAVIACKSFSTIGLGDLILLSWQWWSRCSWIYHSKCKDLLRSFERILFIILICSKFMKRCELPVQRLFCLG